MLGLLDRFRAHSRSFGLSAKFIIPFLIIGFLPTALFTWNCYHILRLGRVQRQSLLTTTTRTALDKIDRNLFERYGDVQAFASNPVLQNRSHWYKPGEKDNPIVGAANRYAKLYGFYPLLLVVDMTGKVIAVNDRGPDGKSIPTASFYGRAFATSGWFQSVLANEYLTSADGKLSGTAVEEAGVDPDVAEVYGRKQLIVHFAAPVLGPDGQPIAVWLNCASLSLVEEVLASSVADLKNSGLTTIRFDLADARGRPLLASGRADAEEVEEAQVREGFGREQQRKSRAWLWRSGVREAGALGYPGLRWLLQASVAESEVLAEENSLKARVGVLIAVIIGTVLVFATLMMRLVARPLRAAMARLHEDSIHLREVSQGVASVSSDLSGLANNAAASVEETSAAMTEIAAMVEQSSSNSRSMVERMEESRTSVRESLRALDEVQTATSELIGSAKQIEDALHAIDRIAFKTNLLAVNAMVESARAGEYGGGFQVVARQVRELSEEAANTSKSTAQVIRRTLSIGAQNADKIERLTGAVRQIEDRVAQVSEIAGQVSAASEEQSRGVSEIDRALVELRGGISATATNAGASNQHSRQLLEQADRTGHLIEEIEVMVEGAK